MRRVALIGFSIEMRLAAACLLSVCGCSQLFGLDPPVRVDGSDAKGAPADSGRDAAIDSAFPASCPPDYADAFGSMTSRYRIITAASKLPVHRTDCNNDLPGATHLAAIQTAGEASNLGGATKGTGMRLFIGAVQLPDQARLGDNWYVVTGEVLSADFWSANEPSDFDGVEDNEENFAHVDPTSEKIYDAPATNVYGAICECDGRSVDASLDALYPVP